MMRLTISGGEGQGATFDLQDGENVAGRSHSANIRLQAADVSGKHLRIMVAGNQAIAENLGRSGTWLDEQPLAEPTSLRPGQELRLGATSLLRVSLAESAASADVASVADSASSTPTPLPAAAPVVPASVAPPAMPQATIKPVNAPPPITAPPPSRVEPPVDADKTGMASPLAPTPLPTPAPALGRTSAFIPSSTQGGDDEVAKTVAARAADSPEGGTRVMQTRIASSEEIEFLRISEQKKAKRKIVTIGLLIGAVLLLVLICWPKSLPPEEILSWPKDDQGNYMDKIVPSANGSREAGGFDILFPGAPDCVVTSIPNGFTAKTWVGRDRDVPMQVTLEEHSDPVELSQTREQSLQRWIEETKEKSAAKGGSWSFDQPQDIAFAGDENGIPYIRVSYHHNETDGTPAGYGYVTLFRYGMRRVVLRTEIPAAEWKRGDERAALRGFDPAPEFVRQYWEGGGETPTADAATLVHQARLELEKISPAAWPAVEHRIIGALVKAELAGNVEQKTEALLLLQRLRADQNKWFNAQLLAHDNAMAQNDRKQARRIGEQCKAVFANPNDRRYHDARKNKW